MRIVAALVVTATLPAAAQTATAKKVLSTDDYTKWRTIDLHKVFALIAR